MQKPIGFSWRVQQWDLKSAISKHFTNISSLFLLIDYHYDAVYTMIYYVSHSGERKKKKSQYLKSLQYFRWGLSVRWNLDFSCCKQQQIETRFSLPYCFDSSHDSAFNKANDKRREKARDMQHHCLRITMSRSFLVMRNWTPITRAPVLCWTCMLATDSRMFTWRVRLLQRANDV